MTETSRQELEFLFGEGPFETRSGLANLLQQRRQGSGGHLQTEALQFVAEQACSRMVAHEEQGGRVTHFRRRKRLVGTRVLKQPAAMDAGFVAKGRRTHHGFGIR